MPMWGHTGAQKKIDNEIESNRSPMPSLFRFILVVGLLVAAGYGALYVLATKFEPTPQEVTNPLGSVKIRKQ